MKTILVYGLQMIIASGILYSYYHFFLRNKNFHRYNRFYLLMAVIVSVVIPFLNIPVYFTNENTDNSFVMQTLSVIASSAEEETTVSVIAQSTQTGFNWFSWQNIFYTAYFLIAFAFVTRILLSVRKIRIISKNYPTEKIGDINFVNTTEPGTPFSFFKWLFWNKEIELQSEKGEQIFRHELFHIQQKHSADIVFIETITAIGWFNPFFHLIKKELKAIHEFLADEYAMQKTESWKYAELLLMQALNTKQNLVNPFFHTQIKRRIAMITTSQKPGHQYLRKLLVLPVAALIVALFAFSYKSINANDKPIRSNKQITIVVDVGHGGIDPGAKSPDGKYTEAQLTLELSKKIEELATDHNIKVVLTRDKDELPGNLTSKTEALKKRIEVASQYNPDAFISIHISIDGSFNKFQNKSSGFLAYITDEKPDGKNIILAKTVLSELNTIYTTDLGVRQRQGPGIYVLDKNKFPALLLECGYINNSNDLDFITNKANQEKVANAILNAVSKFANTKENNPFKIETDKPANDTPKVRRVEVTLVDTVPLIVLDGKIYGRINIKKMDMELSPYDIESIAVLKSPGSVHKYGEQGKYGVIEVFTKKYIVAHPEIKKQWQTLHDSLNKNNNLPLEEVVVTGHLKIRPDNKVSDNATPIFEKVETPPSFPGGSKAWRMYLEKNLDAAAPIKQGAKAGTYTVSIQFLVDKTGNVSSLKSLTNHGHGMEEEVVRVIAKGPKWVPAQQNGHIVNAYHTQPVTFVITEDETPDNTITKSQNDYNNPSNWDYNDPDFLAWRQNAINEIIQIARKEGRAAYTYKGRTYIFAKITDPNPRINTFTELDGLNHQFILNGSLINSVEEINKRYKREDIKKLYFSKRSDIKEKYEIDIDQNVITEIETYK